MNTVKKYLDNLIKKEGNLIKPTMIDSCCAISNRCFNWLNKKDNDGNTYGANIAFLIFICWMTWVHYVTDYKLNYIRAQDYNDCINNISYINKSSALYNNSVVSCRNKRIYFSNANNGSIVGFCILYIVYCVIIIKYSTVYSVISYSFGMILQISLIYYIMIDTNFDKHIRYPAVELFIISLVYGGITINLENVIKKLEELYIKKKPTYEFRDGYYYAEQNEPSIIDTNIDKIQTNDETNDETNHETNDEFIIQISNSEEIV
jgi:hypothetical protein